MTARPDNQLLKALSGPDFGRLGPRLRMVELKSGDSIYEMEDVVDAVWLPERGLLSIISIMHSGQSVESAIVGREGGFGFIEACGAGITFSRCIVQSDGRFWRLPATDYRHAYGESASLRATISNHIELLLTEARQTIACHSLHSAEQRLAWWLLEAQDRIGGDDRLFLTQDFLAAMLAVRRSTVSIVASRLQAQGLIGYSRGCIDLLDREGLQRAACECYATTRGYRRRIEGQLGAGGAEKGG